MSDLASMDATAQAELVRSGEASPTELVDAAIDRIESLNGEINAVIHENFEQARTEAAGDLPDGPFKGVPFVLKDLGACFAGMPLHMGMKVLKEADFRAPVDTFLATRFREAGFVTVAKTNTPQLGILPTTEPDLYGASKNPWDTGRSTGGSSGGSAAAVACGMVPIAHANDGGGSIRIPASACGLVGLKPTRQRTSEGPLIGDVMSGLTVELVVSKSVRDTAAVLEAVHGAAPGDPYVAPAPERPYTEDLTRDPGKLRIGFTTKPAVEVEVDDACAQAVRDAAELCESLGHEVVEASPFDMAPSAGEGGIDIGDTFMTRWAAGQISTLRTMSMLIGREITADDVEPLTWALAEEGRQRDAGRYLSDVAIHQMLSRMIAGWHQSGFDLLLTPTMAEVPQPLGTWDDGGENPIDAFDRALPQGAFTALFNVTGAPAISLPLYESPEGLPTGVQFVAETGREDTLISLAVQLEQALPWADRRAGVFAT
jgi:amidase